MDNSDIKYGFLFDLDGVIIDSEREYSRIWAQINREFPTFIEGFEHVIKGTTLNNILQKYYSDEKIREAVACRLHELENKMRYSYISGAFEFLKLLKDKKIPTALVTSSDDEKMNNLWAQHPELKKYFDVVVTGNLVKNSKPDPEGYLLAASLLKLPPSDCLVFEDSLQGVMAGHNAGAFVVGVAGTISNEKLAPYSHIIIDEFKNLDLGNLIQNIQSVKCNKNEQ